MQVTMSGAKLCALVIIAILLTGASTAFLSNQFSINTQERQGEPGPQGSTGPTGPQGPKGDTGQTGTTGATGPRGIRGLPGNNGTNGSIWYYDSGSPPASTGAEGDWYLNTDNGDVYNKGNSSWILAGNIKGPKGDTGIAGQQGVQGLQGIQGLTGVNGTNGSAWYYGANSPDNDVGVTGDWFFSTNNGDVFVKNGASWVLAGNMKGPKGDKGDTGAQGEKGDTGNVGPAGPIGIQGPQGAQGPAGPQGPSDPDYDSGWVSIGSSEYLTLAHNLGTSQNLLVDITGKETGSGPIHQQYLGLASVPYLGWEKGMGEKELWFISDICRTNDDGYILGGSVYVGSYLEILLVKVNSTGSIMWNKTFSEPNTDFQVYCITQTSGNGFALLGEKNNGTASYVYLAKVDENYAITWNQSFAFTQLTFIGDYVQGRSLIQTSDGGFAFTGDVTGGAQHYPIVVKLSNTGTVQWTTAHQFGSDSASSYAIIQDTDNHYVITGFTSADQGFLIKLNESGGPIWTQPIIGPGGSSVLSFDIVETTDRCYAVAGAYVDGSSSVAFLLKVSRDGTELWNQMYGNLDLMAYSIENTMDGGFIIGANRYFTTGMMTENRPVLIKTSSDGTLQFLMALEKTNVECIKVGQTVKGAYWIAGHTTSSVGVYLIQTAYDGEVGLAWSNLTDTNITLYRGVADTYWNYVRVRIWIAD